MNRLRQIFPVLKIALESELFYGLNGTIDGHSSLHFGMREVPSRTAYFPKSIVGFIAIVLDEFHQVSLQAPGTAPESIPTVRARCIASRISPSENKE
jgi:hypothetical protein